MDAFSMFSDAQAITATAVSTNHLNLGLPKTAPGAPSATKRDIGGGNNQPVVIKVVTAFAGLTSLTANIEVADDAAFSSNKKTVATTGPVALADLTLGAKLPISMIPQGADKQFMRINYVVSGTATAGAITAGLTFGDYSHV